jgi:hypothetical protein
VVPLLISFIDVGFLINNLSTNQKEFVMKNLFLTCMVLFLVFIFGCQESSITDPTQPLSKNDIADVNHNLISLKYQLADPSAGGTLELTGQVSYNNTILPSITDDGKVWVKVILGMSSQLSRSGGTEHPVWKIEQKTEDKVFFTNSGPAAKKLQKAYRITNQDDMQLIVSYSITLKSVKVAKVFLSRIKFQ